MSETLKVNFRNFNTINHTDRSHRSGISSTAFRVTEKRSNSVLANPQSTINLSLLSFEQNINLPKIQKKRKQKKKGGFLQSWLDQALGAPDPFAQQKGSKEIERVDNSGLKTLKKYQLDKRYLQSKSIPPQKIDKMYQSLYIYSHGINKVFEQVLEFVKDMDNNDLLGNFWRAYAKLLQSCTSYQTVFQQVQRDHILNIRSLKNNIQLKNEIFAQQKKQLNQRIRILQRTTQQKQNKYNNLKLDYSALENTLNLTDQAFNEEVSLRLKFEQKINAIYTTYQQLKGKYFKIVEEMSIKNTDMIQKQNRQNDLKNKLLIQKTRVQQLMFLLQTQKQRVQQRNAQIIIKNQQIQDAKALLLAKKNQQQTTHDKMQQHLIKLKGISTKLISAENVINGQKLTMKHQQQHIQKISKSLEQYKQSNNQIYQKFVTVSKKLVQFQTAISTSQVKIKDLQTIIITKNTEIADYKKQLQNIKNERQQLKHQLTISNKNLKDTKQTMQKNNILLQQMKGVKDKYERINQILSAQVKQLQEDHNKKLQQLSIKTEECEGYKLLVEGRNKTIGQLQKAIAAQKQMSKAKQTSFNFAIGKKQGMAMQYQKQKQEIQAQLTEYKIKLKNQQDKCIILQSTKLKAEIELSAKIKILKDIESSMDKSNIKYKQLAKTLQSQIKQKTNINSKLLTTQSVLSTKSQAQRIQVTIMSNLLNQYKAKLMIKAQYIHPMELQDALERARRSQANQNSSLNTIKDFQELARKQKQQINKLQIANKQYLIKIQKLEKNLSELTKQRNLLSANLKKAEESLKNIRGLYQKQQSTTKFLRQENGNQQTNTKQRLQKISLLQKQVINLKSKIQDIKQEAIKKQKLQAKLKKQKQSLRVQSGTQTQIQQEYKKQVQVQINLQAQKISQEVQTSMTLSRQADSPNTQLLQPLNEFSKQFELQNKKQPIPQKKVQSKDFKKALKLTYMRR